MLKLLLPILWRVILINKTLGFLFLLALSANSFAGLIEYKFSGFINQMFEHSGATDENTNVTSSSLFGFDIAIGDIFTGSFIYDSDALESSYRADHPDRNSAVYQNSVFDFRFSVGGYEYQDMSPAGILDSLVVSNDSSIGHPDAFSVQSSNSLSSYYSGASMGFFDADGDAFDDFTLPTELDLNDFLGYGYFHSSLLNRDTEDQLHFYGHATSITKVSEPSSIILLLLGCIGLFRINALTKRS